MYEAHFGLTARPFADVTVPSGHVPLAGQDATLRRLRYGLERMGGPVMLFGPAGSGKTLLAQVLIETIARSSIYVPLPLLPVTELFQYVLDELGTGGPETGRGTSGSVLGRLKQALAARARGGDRPLLVVDEAHLIDGSELFEALRALLNFTTDGAPDLGLVLIGGSEALLRMPHGLLDRLCVKGLIGALDEEDSGRYLLGRLERAGARPALLDAEALRSLHYFADGLPRRLNRVADMAFLIAYARELERPDAECVALAAREMGYDALAA